MSVLTVFVLEAAELDLVGLVLSLLLQSTGPTGKLVLLFSGFGSALERQILLPRKCIQSFIHLIRN